MSKSKLEKLPKRKHFNRSAVLKKFNKNCAKCGTSYRLELHHKDFDRSNNQEDNAEVLCKKCHFNLHRIYSCTYFMKEALYANKGKKIDMERYVSTFWLMAGVDSEINSQEYNSFFCKYG